MLRTFRFFGSQFGRTIVPINERKGFDTLRKQYAMIRFFFHIPQPELLTDDQFDEIWEQLVWVRNKLAEQNTIEKQEL